MCSNLQIIYNYAFSQCTSVTSLKLPDTLQTIRPYAFQKLKITTVEVPSSMTSIADHTFCEMMTLTSITFCPNTKVSVIWGNAFSLTGLISFTIPASDPNLDGSTFNMVLNMETILVDPNSKKYKTTGKTLYNSDYTKLLYCVPTLTGDFEIPSTVITIGDNAFRSCQISSVKLPSSVTTIKSYAFSFSNISTITMTDNVELIDRCAFQNCVALTQITLPNKLKSISKDMLSYSGIIEIVIPDSVEIIDDRAFAFCNKLKKITMSANLTDIGGSVFYGTNKPEIIFPEGSGLSIDNQLLLMDNSRTYISQYFGTTDSIIVIPSTIKIIKLGAFRNRKSLEKIECDGECNVDVIEDFAFAGCTKFFSFPSFSSVTSIGESSFSGTSLNSSIAFSQSLSNIGISCFSGCSLLQSVTLRSDVNVTIGNNAFDGCRSLTRFDLLITSDVYVVFGSSCFANCISLTYFNFISKILSFGDSCFMNSGLRRVDFESNIIHMSSIPSFCFKDCVSLSDVSIPSNIKIIGTESFSNTSINTVNLPDSVVLLSRECFKDCRQLVSFIISSNSNLEQIDYGVFSGCIRFKDISEFRSSHFCFENGAIFNTARDIMYVYPPASPNKFFAFPDKVRTIETSAFIGCVNIESVLIPDNSVVSIGDNAFEGCTSLRNINIPLCVQHIGTNAFKGCRSLICGVIYENKSSSFRSQLVSSGLSKQSLQQCYAKTCAVSMTTPVNRLFLFVFILM